MALSTLEKIVLGGTLLILPSPALAYTISGKITTVPFKQGANLSQISIFSVNTPSDSNVVRTDSLFNNLVVPAGGNPYIFKVITSDTCFSYIDTLNITSDTVKNVQMMKDLGKTSTYFQNILQVFKTLTGTRPSDPPPHRIARWHDSDRPINIFPRYYNPSDTNSMPDSLRTAYTSSITDILAKSNNKVQFNEVSAWTDPGINFAFVGSDSTRGSYGRTVFTGFYPDGSPKQVLILIAKDLVSRTMAENTFRRELGRAIKLSASSPDPNYVMYINGGAAVFHPDEGKAMQYLYTLNNLTNMDPYRDSTSFLGVGEQPQLINPIQHKDLILKLNPNPSRNFVNLEYNLENKLYSPTEVSVYNTAGQLIKTETFMSNPGNNKHKLNTEGLSSGVYFYKLHVGDKEVLRQAVVVR